MKKARRARAMNAVRHFIDEIVLADNAIVGAFPSQGSVSPHPHDQSCLCKKVKVKASCKKVKVKASDFPPKEVSVHTHTVNHVSVKQARSGLESSSTVDSL